MDLSTRLSAAIAYLPIVGWLYVLLFQRRNAFAMFHLRQAVGLVIFLIVAPVGWAVITWLLAWIPFGFLVGNALFALVIVAVVVGVVAWVVGVVNALRGRAAFLPIFGKLANQKLSSTTEPKVLREP